MSVAVLTCDVDVLINPTNIDCCSSSNLQRSPSDTFLRTARVTRFGNAGPMQTDRSAHRRHRSITGLTIYREAWAWGARLTTSTRRFSGAFKSDGFFGLVLP